MNRMSLGGLCVCVVLAFGGSTVVWANSAPEVTNVVASQRGDDSKLVDITYNLTDGDGDPCTVWVSVSDNGGVDWRVPARTFIGDGDIGMGVTPGAGKAVVWDAGADMPGATGSFQVRVWADDGNGPGPKVLVPGGWFPYQNVADPEQWVYVNTFQIDKYEVTNQSYCQFLNNADPVGDHWDSDQEIDHYGDPGSYTYTVHAGKENYPIRYVTYYDAEAFAAWRSSQEGVTYRLPTHHEWEKAAAWDPTQGHYYLYGFHEDSLSCPWCNYNPSSYCIGTTTPVGYYDGTGGRENAKSYYGCYDMSGNVLEWTSEVSGSSRVIRGGAWSNPADSCQCAFRNGYPPSNREDNLGFRLVLDLD